MAPRVAIGGLEHETNTFAAELMGMTRQSDFRQERGEALLRQHSSARTPLGGFISAAADLGYEVVPTYFAYGEPSGTIEEASYQSMKKTLLDAIREVLPVDAVALDLHGAGVSECCEDIEGDIGRAVRELVGPKVPIVASLDLHGNIYDAMLDVFVFMVGYRLYPHEDQLETGYKAFSMLPRLLSGDLQPACVLEHLPMLLPLNTTDEGFPHHEVNLRCQEIEKQHADVVLDLRVFHGFPFADVSKPSACVMCTTANKDTESARKWARHIAATLWDMRGRFLPQNPRPAEAVERALHALKERGDNGPVVINETSDNTGSGSPGDATHLLRAMLAAGLGKLPEAPGRRSSSGGSAAFGWMWDGEAVQQAIKAGVGGTVKLTLGGKHGPRLLGAPLEVEAYVRGITDGKFILEKFAPGLACNLGPTALLVVEGIDVIVVSKRLQTFCTALFQLHGLDVHRYRVIALKSSIHFRAGFRELPNGYRPTIVTTDAPGISSNNMNSYTYTKLAERKWPIHDDATYGPSEKEDRAKRARQV